MKANALKISEGIYWVGVLDWDRRDFHGFNLDGTSYNCYLVFGKDKVALIDNSEFGQSEQLWGRMKDAFSKESRDFKIDIMIQNHIENDHIGSIVEIINEFPDLDFYCSEMAEDGLRLQLPNLPNIKMNTVKTGDKIDLGNKTLTFIDASMLHWPDSMFTMALEDGILFSNDAFGQHLCLSENFDDEVEEYIITKAAQKFYANLVALSSPIVAMKLKELKDSGLKDKIKLIAPSHGLMWHNPNKIINLYHKWATGKCKDKITFIYDSMHHSTQKMAQAMAEGVMSENVEVKMYYMHEDEQSEVIYDVLDSKAVFVGAPTMMNNPFPSLGSIIYFLTALNLKNTGYTKKAVVFGSKGWAGGANEKLSNDLKKAGFDIVGALETRYVPNEEILNMCFDLGKKVASNIKNN